jgi:uncharacterized protein (TIGR03437 family)
VRLGDRSLPLLYASDNQINAQLPYDVAVNTDLQLTVRRGGALSVPVSVTVAMAQPAIFTVDQTSTGQGAVDPPVLARTAATDRAELSHSRYRP